MTRGRRVRDLLDLAKDLSPEARRTLLDSECAGDPDLRDEVESLLASLEGMGDFMAVSAPETMGVPLPPALAPGDRVGRYEVIRELGAGGTGTVYEARQVSPRRRVAVKVMRAGFGSETAARRFFDEAEILARFRHPGIAHVYESGGREGTPWFALEFVDGARTVREHAEAAGLSLRARLEMFLLICDAIGHGHEKGIIHRDVKPANVLVDRDGRPKVIDFGIASVTDPGAAASSVLRGTLPYMSPEACEAGGEKLDVRSDVYSLGVLLFELLTGRLPLIVTDVPVAEALTRVREDAPTPAGTVDRRLRGDLEAILEKALAKDREDRYSSVAGLADDVRRHLRRRPVDARGGGLLYQLSRLTLRHRVAAVALTALVLVAIVAAVLNRGLAVKSERARREADVAREEADFEAYVANIAAASLALRGFDVGEARARLRLTSPRMRGWEWRHLMMRLDDSETTLGGGRGRLRAGAITPDGERVAAVFSGSLVAWDVATGATLMDVPLDGARATALAFRPGGMQIAVGCSAGQVEVFDVAEGAILRAVVCHPSVVISLAYTPDGRQLITGSADHTIQVRDAEDLALLRTLEGHPDRVISVRPDVRGGILASAGREGAIRFWDLETGEMTGEIEAHESSVEGVALSPDGRRIATVSRDRTVRLWDRATGEAICVQRAHRSNVRAVAFHPDSSTFASASWDHTVRLWDAERGDPVATLRGHAGQVIAVAFRPVEPSVVSFSSDGFVKIFRSGPRDEVSTIRGFEDLVQTVAVSPDGEWLATGSRDGSIRTFRTADLAGPAAARVELGKREARKLWFLPDGGILVCRRRGGAAVFASDSLEVVREIPLGEPEPQAVLDPGGRLLHVGNRAGGLSTHDITTGERLRSVDAHASEVVAIAVEPAGRWLASVDPTGEVHVRDAATLELRWRSAPTNTGGTYALAFSPGGELLVWGVGPRLHTLDVETLSPGPVLDGHNSSILAITFSPDGRRIATGARDATIRLWDSERLEQVAVLHGHTHAIWSLAFSPDGASLYSGSGTWEGADSTVKVWETR